MTYNKYNDIYIPCGPIFPPYKKRKEKWYYAIFYKLGRVTVSESQFNKLKKKYKLKEIICTARAYNENR